MSFYEILRGVAVVRTDVSEDRSASIIRVTRMSFLQFLITANVVPSSSILVTLTMDATCSSETSILTRATRHNIPEDDFLHVNRHVI
jgi:hypothetical protein